MPIKPVHRTTYVLSIIVGGYSLAVHSLTALIISIILRIYELRHNRR